VTVLAEGTNDTVWPGLVKCARCGVHAAPRKGHLSVHFAKLEDVRPCPSGWPAQKGKS
jgi:hypothetical protein